LMRMAKIAMMRWQMDSVSCAPGTRAPSFRRFSTRRARHGGAIFTMLLFLLLIISSGLMYYYFQRTRMLERELVKWRAGEKPSQAEVAEETVSVKETAKSLLDRMKDMPGPAALRELAGQKEPAPTAAESTPPTDKPEDKAPVISEAKPVEEPDDSVSKAAARRTAQLAATAPTEVEPARATAEEPPDSPKAVEVPKSPYTPEVAARRGMAAPVAAAPEPEADAPKAGVRVRVPVRQTAAPTERVAQPRAASARRQPTRQTPQAEPAADEIGSILRRTTNP
jgi:hypothetical protein